MINVLIKLGGQRRYWAALAIFGIGLEAVALYYQYVLDEWPCVLCIHVRIWVMAFVLVALLALFVTSSRPLLRACHFASLAVMLGLLERSYQLLAIERGWVFGECNLELGLPAWLSWLTLDKWIPWLFEVQTTCGYTPLILFNISMAEILLVLSIFLVLATAAMFASSWLPGD